MRKLILAISTIAFAASAAYADPIADRKAIMKERGGIAGELAKMAKGETAFDAAAVKTALEALKTNEAKLDIDALFPPGSETGGKTTAAPKIWEDMAGFKAADEKLKQATDAALAAPPQDVGALGATMGSIGGACGGCHKEYRLPS